MKQEQFELEVLDRLKSGRFLDPLVFGGGTMLRLCHELNRYSVDLDFWIVRRTDEAAWFKDLKKYLSGFYTLTDGMNKRYTLLFELRSPEYPRKLKLEIRKDARSVRTEQMIAYSAHSNLQVLLTVVTLEDMMRSKIEAFLDRREIRDLFDMEFMLKKGIALAASKEDLEKLRQGIKSMTKKDYSVKLGQLLEA
ncbi:MAG: hypothetical protein COT00_05510, partial [Candidatus Omnitrophica bacterium CG07_land_8_20_14_0_80_50_8]